MNLFTSSTECVCICTYNLCKCVFPCLSESHLCSSCSTACNNVKLKSAVAMTDGISRACFFLFLSPSHSLSLLVSQCASMCHSPWLFTCIRLDTLIRCLQRTEQAGTTFQSHSHPWKVICVSTECVGGYRVRYRRKRKN